jgi:TPR repeat protein
LLVALSLVAWTIAHRSHDGLSQAARDGVPGGSAQYAGRAPPPSSTLGAPDTAEVAGEKPATARPSQAAQPGNSADGQAHEGEIAGTEAEWRDVQAALLVLGHYRGPLDGAFSAATRAAVAHWQSFEGHDETGRLDRAQFNAVQQDSRLLDRELNTALRFGGASPKGTPPDTIKGAEARFNRATAFEQGVGQTKDPAEAAFWYALAAKDGWPAAYTNLGTLYARGQGVGTASPYLARAFWKAAAALGEATAMFDLGVQAEKGLGVPVDLPQAKQWYGRGVERHNAASAAALKRLNG